MSEFTSKEKLDGEIVETTQLVKDADKEITINLKAFKDYPSATHYKNLERALLAYQIRKEKLDSLKHYSQRLYGKLKGR